MRQQLSAHVLVREVRRASIARKKKSRSFFPNTVFEITRWTVLNLRTHGAASRTRWSRPIKPKENYHAA
jgi:hypothetical protein